MGSAPVIYSVDERHANDPELALVALFLTHLSALTWEARHRVLSYVVARLEINLNKRPYDEPPF